MPDAPHTLPGPTDRECLERWRRDPQAESLRPLLERYGSLTYSSAYRRTGNSKDAQEVVLATFLVLARRARKLPRKTLLAGWLFRITALAARKLKRSRTSWWRRFKQKSPDAPPTEAAWWDQLAPQIDAAIDRLSAAQREALLLRIFLHWEGEQLVQTIRRSESRIRQRVERGLNKLAHRLRRRKLLVDVATLAQACSLEGCALPLSEQLAAQILTSIEAVGPKRPPLPLARRLLRTLAWRRWRRRLAVGSATSVLSLALAGAITWHISSKSGHSQFLSMLVFWSVRFQLMRMAETARPWPPPEAGPPLDARAIREARDLYQMTNIWLARLDFTSDQWKQLEPRSIGPMPNFVRPDGMWLLRNPKATRSGLIGVLGYELDWTQAEFAFGGVAFTNVGVRGKGNIGSLSSPKRSFKVDLNRFAKGQKLAGLDELTFNNLVWDYSYLSDALGYEFFRDAGVPAPRTAYAWFSASVAERAHVKPLGLYVMVETIDESFADERFGSKKTPVFKPVTYELFEYLGPGWPAYATIYDLKTKATPEQLQRVIDFARLVSLATEAEFAAQAGDFLDMDEFARFLAGEVLLSSYDSILSDGQNFYMYLDPRSNKLGFIPWDLDSAWGFFWLGSKEEFERASIWHPWVGENRFIARVMAVEEFRSLYRGHLENFLDQLFTAERLHGRIDTMARVIREPIAAESAFRLNKFEQAVGLKPLKPSPGESSNGLNHPAHLLKNFVTARAKSVREQLEGKSNGVILKTPGNKNKN